MSKENYDSNQELNIAISLISEKILNEIIDYIKVNSENPNNIMQKLTKIYKYIKNILSNSEDIIISENICTDPNEEVKECTSNNLQQNTKYTLPNNRYLIFKLKRQLKQEQEKNKLRELDYLEKLYSLQKELKTFENAKNSTLNRKFKTGMLKEINFVGKGNDEEDDNFIIKEIKNKNHYSVSSFKIKPENKYETPINIKSSKVSSNGFNPISKTNLQKTEKPKNGRNFCIKELELNNNNVNNVYQKTVNGFMDKYRIKMYSKTHQKIKNINCVNKHDFNEIRESVEKGRKKIRLIKDSISPALFHLRNLKTNNV